ncbi:MAG: dihydrofolate reductase, partial [Planctomycetota bacterium]
PGAEIARSLEEELERARETKQDEVFILGGAEIYTVALPEVDRLELTIVHADVSGDTLFPECDLDEWSLIDEQRHEADPRHAYAFSFRTYERRG